jgi:hypothetical protein
MQEDEGDWSRPDWARWWLDHGDPSDAAQMLRAGDELTVSADEYEALAGALSERGLRAMYEDGVLFVHTPEEAESILAEIDPGQWGAPVAEDDRRPPARAPGPERLAPAKRSA